MFNCSLQTLSQIVAIKPASSRSPASSSHTDSGGGALGETCCSHACDNSGPRGEGYLRDRTRF
jgi:hypothetical protein